MSHVRRLKWPATSTVAASGRRVRSAESFAMSPHDQTNRMSSSSIPQSNWQPMRDHGRLVRNFFWNTFITISWGIGDWRPFSAISCGREWNEAKVPADSEFDAMLGLLPEDRISGLSQALRVLNVFPMNETFDAAVHADELIAEIKQELGVLDEAGQRVFADLSLDDMMTRLAEALGDHYRSEGDITRELLYRRCDLIRRPWKADVHFRAARCIADRKGEQAEAIQHCHRALALDPKHAAAEQLLSTLKSR